MAQRPTVSGVTFTERNIDFTGTDTLMPPATSSVLQALAIGKGLFNYTCAGQSGDTAPTFDAQYTELYDAAPLIQVLPDQESFAALIPMVFSYNYGEMRNSTMNCMGTIGTLNSTAVITLYDIDTFEVTRSETLLAPDSPEKNAMWSHAYSADGTWEIYRVETFNGRPPATCIKPEDSIEIEYAAEYWFYRN